MLAKIIQSGPLLVPPWAVLPKAHVEDFRSALRLLLMNTFLMACEVVDGTEPFFAGAVGLITFKQFSVSRFVFSARVSFPARFRSEKPVWRTSCQKDTFRSIGNRDNRI